PMINLSRQLFLRSPMVKSQWKNSVLVRTEDAGRRNTVITLEMTAISSAYFIFILRRFNFFRSIASSSSL
ncbi:hypothetical protein L9F63_020070, partial [Diploptera punctata]